jgi:dinuclear metal center YbgI/SA1388 family protein
MPTVREILDALETIAPRRFAFAFDKVGLQVGDADQQVGRAVVALDRSLAAVRFAREKQAGFLLTHHPLIFRPLDSVDAGSHVGRTVLELAKSGISFAAAHTNWDSARGGINDTLAGLLGLRDIADFGTAADVDNSKLSVTCPSESVDAIIDSASACGAGIIGSYSRCAFSAIGVGHFMSDETANPAVGEAGKQSSVPEVRIEMSVPTHRAHLVARAIKAVHPYEQPAIDLFALQPHPEQPAGRVGSLLSPVDLGQLMLDIEASLKTVCWGWGHGSVQRIAVVGGSADEEWRAAQAAGADVLVTGEVKQHVALEAVESGFRLIAAGHYATENPGCETLRQRMAGAVPGVEWILFEPEPGFGGRPCAAPGR